MVIEIGNPFTTNRSLIYEMVVLSQPEFILQYSNTLHFASPNQELIFIFQLTDWFGNLSFQSVQFLCNDTLLSSFTTDENGRTIITIIAPSHEGVYNLSVVSLKNITRYELPARLDYHLTVSISIPVLVELDYYEVIPPLQKIVVYLRIVCLNGSLVEGIEINITWESIGGRTVTQPGGLAIVHLPVPKTNGNYILYYEIEQTYNLAASAGAINISISLVDILVSQGIAIIVKVVKILIINPLIPIP